jgi:hypothetical protein
MDHLQGAQGARPSARTTELPSAAATSVDADRKLRDTLQARAALAGYELVQLSDDTFIVSRWGMFRSLDHIAAVEHFLQRVEAARA